MASQVLSGASNPSYTNNTGQNVRIVINYMSGTATGIALNWAGVSAFAALAAIGRNLATSYIDIVDPPNSPFVYSVFGSTSPVGAATYPGYGVASNNNALALTVAAGETYATGPVSETDRAVLGTVVLRQVVPGTPAPGTKTTGSGALPTELMLAPGQRFSASCGAYNIVVIPEAG